MSSNRSLIQVTKVNLKAIYFIQIKRSAHKARDCQYFKHSTDRLLLKCIFLQKILCLTNPGHHASEQQISVLINSWTQVHLHVIHDIKLWWGLNAFYHDCKQQTYYETITHKNLFLSMKSCKTTKNYTYLYSICIDLLYT